MYRLTILTNGQIVFIRSISLVLVFHRGIVDILWFAISHTLSLALFVEQVKKDNLGADDSDQDAKDGEDSFDSGNVMWGVFGFEQQRTDNVAYCARPGYQSERE